ncbi:excinuclease [Clostridium niameyense]|uniref:Excinuclease n=1 Tax=Clostridium niameyense TaxID=1622073 RepID=A0A6M0R8L3_9CLOT|nr:UvrB/UvrC motif-containing protein [Clostridium niameyense]NEZ46585.1 excinuclease [Clostridium niameyense]
MLCDRCKNNPATVHIIKIINGKEEQMNLCENCAKESESLSLPTSLEFIPPFSVQNILSGILDYMYNQEEEQITNDFRCPSCGTNYREFKEKGLLGCSECYRNFQNTLEPIIKRIQGNIEHIGKIPKKAGQSIILERQILKLKNQLQECVNTERYEEAAKLRDKIKGLENKNY